MGNDINPDAQDSPTKYLLLLSSIQLNTFVRFYFIFYF